MGNSTKRRRDLDPHIEEELVRSAKRAMEVSYAPYSNFKVGAALLTKEGKIYTGANIENPSYGLTICAERVAIFKAISEGARDFIALAVVASQDEPVAPCGACRQVLFEFNEDLLIVSHGLKGKRRRWILKEIFPGGFKFKEE